MSLDDKAWLEQLRAAGNAFLTVLLHPKVSKSVKRQAVQEIETLTDSARQDVTGSMGRAR
jgi:hypothetical protein